MLFSRLRLRLKWQDIMGAVKVFTIYAIENGNWALVWEKTVWAKLLHTIFNIMSSAYNPPFLM